MNYIHIENNCIHSVVVKLFHKTPDYMQLFTCNIKFETIQMSPNGDFTNVQNSKITLEIQERSSIRELKGANIFNQEQFCHSNGF